MTGVGAAAGGECSGRKGCPQWYACDISYLWPRRHLVFHAFTVCLKQLSKDEKQLLRACHLSCRPAPCARVAFPVHLILFCG